MAGIVIVSLVFGLRSSREERCLRRQATRRSNQPKPTSVTLSPFARASITIIVYLLKILIAAPAAAQSNKSPATSSRPPRIARTPVLLAAPTAASLPKLRFFLRPTKKPNQPISKIVSQWSRQLERESFGKTEKTQSIRNKSQRFISLTRLLEKQSENCGIKATQTEY